MKKWLQDSSIHPSRRFSLLNEEAVTHQLRTVKLNLSNETDPVIKARIQERVGVYEKLLRKSKKRSKKKPLSTS